MVPLKIAGLLFFIPLAVSAQGLFESAGKDADETSVATTPAKSFALSGYIRGALFAGQNTGKESEIKAAYAEVSLKIDAEKSSIGKAFAEIRFTPGFGYGSPDGIPDVREAWVAVSPGHFDLSAGKKILAWGRADGINPTNTVTPMNGTARSSAYDDTRLGNIMADLSYTLPFGTLQAIWLPLYAPDVLPIEVADLPAGVTIADPVYPDTKLDRSGFALRCDLSFAAIDGSISYCNSYRTLPGFDYRPEPDGISLIPTAYRTHTIGGDFSTTLGAFGIRGEGAITIPFDDPADHLYIPQRHGAYVFGIDRSISDWSFLVQYSGVYVPGFTPITEPVLSDPFNPLALQAFAFAKGNYEIHRINRLFTGTTNQTSHSITGRIGWRGLYETLEIELAGLYTITTEEYAVNPSIGYDIADALHFTVGGRYLRGPGGSLNDLIDDQLSHVYTELKFSF